MGASIYDGEIFIFEHSQTQRALHDVVLQMN